MAMTQSAFARRPHPLRGAHLSFLPGLLPPPGIPRGAPRRPGRSMRTIRTIRCNHQHTTLPPSSLRPPTPASHGLARWLPDPLAQAEAVHAAHAHHTLPLLHRTPMAVRAGVA
ncbi:hypothetical protein ZWY2020_009348 [Hordeum vulgare]|nr:hypothetical protein ZWY2020_009348 [Hordeum vulgare]